MNLPLAHLSDTAKHVGDTFAIGAFVASLLSWLPAATALLTIAWIIMRMVESWQTIKLNNRKLRGE